MQILIVDDEQLARDRLVRMVNDLDDHAVVGEAGNGVQAVQLAERMVPDVVLLDIRMPGMDGLEAARHLLELEQPPAVVFCTAYEEHAIEAFDVQAVGYLLKPVRREDLARVLGATTRVNKAQLESLRDDGQKRRTHISARTRRGIELVPVHEVCYFQADQKYVTARHISGELIIDEPLRDLENEFGELFIRVHRNALVASRAIEGIERDEDGKHRLRLKQIDETLEISRRHVANVRKYVRTL
ncbi:MAG: LytTR family DNA-binding domain-containing protein [Pseudomonadota bacterium]